MDILIVYASSGRGLAKDADILQSAITSMGHDCQVEHLPPTPEWQSRLSHYRYRLLSRYLPSSVGNLYYTTRAAIARTPPRQARADLVIHLENIRLSYLNRGKSHWLIPNQEWFIESRLPYLRFIDRIQCKTKHAVGIFSQFHSKSTYLGFTGAAKSNAPDPAEKDLNLAIHIAGNSQFRGTGVVLDCWLQHPEWPRIMVVSQHLNPADYSCSNIEIASNLTDQEIEALWQKASFAILPSEVEGYGQVLAEALANGCVTVTTDAPPMNELVEECRGYLAEPEENQPFRLGTRFKVSKRSLEKVIDKALSESPEHLDRIAHNATQWYALNHQAFLSRLTKAVNELAEQPQDQSGRAPQGKPVR
ncbi:glycosyltransferase [Marinobacter shengliensis]|uniref:glycosyltransferase n=1 Tax=Marinobacter shengliensis TaxID=1389223 RepID=UPI002572E1E4|nr:glycosyltransferase [Marinobacter shengliensis]BEH14470.1 hypothetical protein MAALD49_18380 [Marinobacter shengliensis]